MIVVIFSLRATIYYVFALIVFNENVDIKFSAHDTFLEYPSLCIMSQSHNIRKYKSLKNRWEQENLSD